MRLGFLRRKNTDLPLFNGRRNGTRSSSPQRKVPSRKHLIIGLIVFVVLLLIFRPTSSSQPKRKEPKTRYDRYYNAREDLFNNRLFFIKSVASVCTNLDKNNTFWEQSAARYMPLGMDENADTHHKYFFALMLRDSSIHLPTIIDNLLRVIYHLGEMNVFMSIYEAGSTDDGHTTAMVDVIKTTMEAIGIEYHIEVDVGAGPSPRNAVLAPLKTLYRSQSRVFNTIVMMGDDLWCAEGFLELLFHSRGQAASLTCATDVHTDGNQFFISPGHDINGKLFQKGKINSYIQDAYSSTRFKENRPIRVQSCFSSVTVLDPTPFYPPYDFSFTSQSSHSDRTPAPWENKCGFSSELDMALHLAASGFDRAMLIPRSQTASNLLEFFKIHRTEAELADRERLHKELGVWVEEDTGGKDNPFGKGYDVHENEILWQISPRVADKCTGLLKQANLLVECQTAQGMEWLKLTLPQTYKDSVAIQRGLPVLP